MGDHMPQHPILRLGPGLHSRGMRAVGRAVVGTAGALPAHHQDASAPGEGWEVSQKLESLKPCEIPHYGYKHPPSQNFGFEAGFPLPFYCFVAKQTYRSTSGEAATEYDAEAASLGKAAEFWVAAFGLGEIDPTVDAY